MTESMIHMLTMTTAVVSNFAILLLRFAIGPCFVIHGLGKLGIVGSGNMAGFEGWLKSLGFPAAKFQARAAMLTEIIGGICVTLGLFFRPALVLLFVTMLVAALVGHRGAGYLITNNPPGNEYALNLAILCVVMFMLGGGMYSLDYILLMYL